MFTPNLQQDEQINSGETQLKLFGRFLSQHDNRLAAFQNDISVDHSNIFHSNFDELLLEAQTTSPTVALSYTPPAENITIFQLIDSDNKILNKVLTTFFQLCEEATQLKNSAKIHQMKLLYFDEHLCSFEEQGKTQNCLIRMSDLLELLHSVQCLTQRCIIVASTILQQLGALFSCKAIDNFLDVQLLMQFQVVFNHLGDLIMQLIIFDEILTSSNFQHFWQSYQKAVHSIDRHLNRLTQSYNKYEVNALANILNSLEILFNGSLFQTFLDGTFKVKEQISSKALPEFSGHFYDYIRVNMVSIEKFPTVLSEFDETELIIKINALSILFHNFSGQLEQKTLKNLLDINSKNIGITLIGNRIWNPEEFLRKHAQTLLKNHEKHMQEGTRLRQIYLQTKNQTISQEARQYCSQTLMWSLQMASALNSAGRKLQSSHLKHLGNLCLQGLKYAGQLAHTIKSVTNLHVTSHIKMTKSTLSSICKLLAYLKVIQVTFQNHFVKIAQSVQCVMQHLAYEILFIIAVIKKKLSSQSSNNERNLDTLSALQIAEKCLYGPSSKTRILVASLALNFANPMRVLSPIHLQKLHKLINRLELLSNLQANTEQLCDPSFMYWHQSILTVYLKQIIAIKETTAGATSGNHSPQYGGHACMKYMIQSADNCIRNFETLYTINNRETIETFRSNIYKSFCQEISIKLCAQIETLLRIQVHESLAQSKPNPFLQGLQDCRELLNFIPIEINGSHFVLKDRVENYLSSMFYNLTTISLHDWRTYSEMRHLGIYKFNLITIEDYLPTQQLEQGIDVLEIMRNIHVFVSQYLYNMNNQIFIECTSNNKHLNTIGIKHIANSLRTHGSGIINTTINFTYQFLRKKLYTFSQFLFDEHIKSRLMKDLKHFRSLNKDRSVPLFYSYERASNFNKGIRKFGLTPDGQSYLDLFRQLISQIGNAMGYIRLLRSGAIHASSNVSVYIPKFVDSIGFTKIDTDFNLANKSAENLENNIRNLSRYFGDETEYFKLLTMAFAPFFRDPKNIHLRNFYLIIPALTINFVEYIINAKEKIHKKDKHGVLFVDDGLAIGLAYILRLLNQNSDFNSLHWFKSVKQHYANERSKIKAQREQIIAGNINGPVGSVGNSTSDDKLQQTLALTEKRINAHQMEFNLLYYNLQSSKIFFQ